MKKINIHVLYRKDGTWAVQREGVDRAAHVCKDKKSAIKNARALAQKEKAELVIHDMHDRITDKDSFGHDPFPPKDTVH